MTTTARPEVDATKVARRRKKVPHPSEQLRLARDFDLRTTRDLSSRRYWRESVRGLARTIIVVTGDFAAGIIATWLGLGLVGMRLDDWADFLPRILLFAAIGQSAARTLGPGRSHPNVSSLLRGVLTAQIALWILDTLYHGMSLPLRAHVALFGAMAISLTLWRFLLAYVLRRVYHEGVGRKRTIVIADHARAREVLERFQSMNEPCLQYIGHVSPRDCADALALGGLDSLAGFIEEHDIDDVVISAHLPEEDFRHVVRTCFLHGTAVSVVPGIIAQLPCRVSSRQVMNWPILELEPSRIHLAQVAAKRTFDIIGSLLLLLIFSPLLAAIAIAIRVDSPGPIFFGHRRSGLAGRKFKMLKFRSMHPNAEQRLREDTELYRRYLDNDCKLPPNEDPRITRVGQFLRASSLDELPQLINVLRGDMSLIGPRPVVDPELERYGEWLPLILAVRPGMTGYWQVLGRSTVMYPERAHMDIFYVTSWSIGLDLKILFMTIPAVLRQHGAH
jgi:exopolysaccharide production protein ExoY